MDTLGRKSVQNKSIILASGSEIRRQILQDAGVKFSVIKSHVDEEAIKQSLKTSGASFEDIAICLAQTKARHVSQNQSGLVIGCDQIMIMDKELFDKAQSLQEARERLLSMRGKHHDLLGAIVICEQGQMVWKHMAKTRLWVRDFSDKFLDEYIGHEGEALLKSVGAYQFEGRGAQLFSKVQGDFFSILGLSLLPLLEYLRERGMINR